jgi:hypothetical protein
MYLFQLYRVVCCFVKLNRVTGIRKDAWAQANPLNIEADKTIDEQDHYRHPEVHNQSTERSIAWLQHSEIVQRLAEKTP